MAAPSHSHGPEPELERQADGSYLFVGTSIRAVIARNGDVTFGHRRITDARIRMPEPPKPAAQKEAGFTENAHFAPRTALVGGSVRYQFFGRPDAEKRWFMEGTRALREQLAERARRPKDLAGALNQIWSGPGTFAEHRAATLALWASLADDEVGAEGRRVITKFVAERCPAGSGCAFSAEELAAFNARRPVAAPFAPYP